MIVHDTLDKTLEEMDLHKLDTNYISVYIFRRIFKSTMTNQDTM
jgi:hypothetical protein